MAIRTKKIIYTPADIYAMSGAPQEVLPAPPAGYVNNIIGISHQKTFNSAAYTGATIIQYQFPNAYPISVFSDNAILGGLVDVNHPIKKNSNQDCVWSTQQAMEVTTNLVAATGDSDIIAYIIYETVLLDI